MHLKMYEAIVPGKTARSDIGISLNGITISERRSLPKPQGRVGKQFSKNAFAVLLSSPCVSLLIELYSQLCLYSFLGQGVELLT